MYDLCVIGSGWAGFNAALRATELGASVALVEKDELGGVCLNRGCIPTKTLANSARIIREMGHYQEFGINVNGFVRDFEKMKQRKEQVIADLKKGIQFQLQRGKVEVIQGQAKIISPNEVEAGVSRITAKFIIIASGSRPAPLSILKFNGDKIISSNEMLEMPYAPQSLLIVGGGAIGCEFAGIFSALGSQVTIVEALEHLLPSEDADIAKKLESVFKKYGIKVLTKSLVSGLDLGQFEKILVAIGRQMNIEDFCAGQVPLKCEANRIIVNEFLQTSVENIYAAGDCVGGKLLAHVAAYEGVLAAENIFGQRRPVDYTAVPNCIFTHPEIASVGLSEKAATDEGREIKVARFDFMASGMAHILEEADGFIKLIADSKSGDLLGGSIVGPKATELIGILTVAVKNRLKSKDLYGTIFAHPSLSEGIWEAAKKLSTL
jgi:dihydrolipoamide dehydrogenase